MSVVVTTPEEARHLVNTIFSTLPRTLDDANTSLFVDTCSYVDTLLHNRDFCLLLMPFHCLAYSVESAYGEGFSWVGFVHDILASGSTTVICKANTDRTSLEFSDGSRVNFLIAVVHSD